MSDLRSLGTRRAGRLPRRFWVATSLVCAALGIAGLILARRFGFPPTIAAPVVAAFCWQAALYSVAVSRSARAALREACRPPVLAGTLIVASAFPYAVYSLPTGQFSAISLGKLVVLCSVIALPYVLWRAPARRLGWQDALVICALAYPMVSGLSTLFRDVYQGFEPPAHRLDALGKLMLIPLGLFAFLELRRLAETGFRLLPRRADWRPALLCSAHGFPWIAITGLVTGYLRWESPLGDLPGAVAATLGKLVGIYFTTALAEEFLLRGVVQNLLAKSTGRPLVAQGIAAALFGAAHLGRGGFPNWPYAITAAVLGWFCGRAYARSGSVTPAMITHALAVAGQELLFE